MKWFTFIIKVILVCLITTSWLGAIGWICKKPAINFVKQKFPSVREQERIALKEMECQLARASLTVGKRSYDRGQYEQALMQLETGLDYQKYLIPSEQEQLKELLAKTREACNALAEKKRERR